MTLIKLLLFIFSFSLMFNSSMIILNSNTVYSALFLILSFISAASILFLLECDYIAIIFITIYVGAVAVLFVFVVMMLNSKNNRSIFYSTKHFPTGLFLGSLFLIEIYYILYSHFKPNPYFKIEGFDNCYINFVDNIDSILEIEALGQILYTQYVIEFLIAGMVLLLAAVGVVVLLVSRRENKIKHQFSLKQLSRLN